MLYEVARACLFRMTPETAHAVTMANIDWASAVGLTKLVSEPFVHAPVKVMGLTFPNAVGLAAGMDKTGAHVSSMGRLGFGHIEIGTITPREQPGNPKPRCWRLIPAGGIINHMGFNNCGADQALINLASAEEYRRKGGIVGINIGKQNTTAAADAIPDYIECMEKMHHAADYFAINISCPNAPNLTGLQGAEYMSKLLAAIKDTDKRLSDKSGRKVPITVKVSPDVDDDRLKAMVDEMVRFGIDAVTSTNTTLSRKGVEHLDIEGKSGGLSGKPLYERSTEVTAMLAEHLKGELPIIATGGVMSVENALEKVRVGASLVQLYTGFIYKGPALIGQAARAIEEYRRNK